MTEPNQKLTLPPDLYSRNTVIAQIAFKLYGKENISVLDVGGYNGKLKLFFPDSPKFIVLDRKPKPTDEIAEYRQSDAKRIPFSDRNFDVVVASDLFEHVPERDHRRVFDEMSRVSKNFLIVGAPFRANLTLKAEEQIRSQFFANAGFEHPFLTEHDTNGLPTEESFEKIVTEKGYSFIKVQEGNLMNWYLQQLYTGAQTGEAESFQKFGFYSFFNEHLFELGNLRTPTYRTIYVIAKDGKVPGTEIKNELTTTHSWQTETFLQLMRIAFDDLRFLLNQKKAWLEKEIEDVRTKAKKSLDIHRDALEEVRNYLHEKEQALNFMKSIITQKDQELNDLTQIKSAMEKEINEQNSFIKKLNEDINSKNSEIDSLRNQVLITEAKIQEKDQIIAVKNAELEEVKRDLTNHSEELKKIVNSRAWKAILTYGRIKTAVITNPLKLVKKAWSIYRKLGIKVLMHRVMRKVKKQGTSHYEQYIEETTPSPQDIKLIKQEQADFEYRPIISIVMPVYNIEEKYLVKAIESVRSQTYERWELCLCDDASTAAHIKPLLQKYAAKDKRIKVTYREKNGGIVKASNDALALAQGAYVGLLDNDDELAATAFYEVIKVLQQKKYDLIYSDEDKMELDGTRNEPTFKPDWSPDLLLSCNYISHFGVYRRKVLQEIGGFREGFDGSQDYDLVLRFTEKTQEIKHIAKILYHWRKIPGSTAVDVNAKPYAYEAAKHALSDALKRRKIDARVTDGLWKGSYRVERHNKELPLVSIIIPFKDKKNILKICVESIFEKTSYKNFEILLVDNQSTLLETEDYLKTFANEPRVKVLKYNKPFNYSAINNFAVKQAAGEVLLLLNNDTEVISPNWIQTMLSHALRPEVGAVGAKLLYPNNTIQHAGVLIGLNGLAGHAFNRLDSEDNGYVGFVNVIRNYSAVTAACVMVRKSVYLEVGGLNEKDLAVAFNDVDFCLRLREKNYLIVYTPYAVLYHHESLSRGYDMNLDEVKYMTKKYSALLKAGDPYYNPNLTHERPDFSLRLNDTVQIHSF